jgi:transposase, IS30 family
MFEKVSEETQNSSDLTTESALRGHVFRQIRKGRSLRQISGGLKQMPECEQVSNEKIYQAVYILPSGELRKEIISLLRQSRKRRRPCSQGRDRRGGLIGMVSIQERTEHVLTRELFGGWEGDFIKGAANASATLVERKSCYTILAKVKNCSADAALSGFEKGPNRVQSFMCPTLTYDQGKEMGVMRNLPSD